jgi:hypothetical protein
MVSSIRYPTDRTNPGGAIPVYICPTPPLIPNPPNNKDLPAGAVPVSFVAAGNSLDSGPIPVRTTTNPGPPFPWPSDQGQNRAAIPVYDSPIGVQVWITNAVGSPIVNEVTFTQPLADVLIPDVLGVCTATNNPSRWAIVESLELSVIISGSGQLVITSLDGATLGTHDIIVSASNAGGTGTGTITVEFT